MLAPKALALEFVEMGEHRAVFHVMPVDNKVVRGLLHIAVLLHIGTAVLGVFLVKAVLQVEVRLVYRLHHGIVDVGIRNADPAHQIAVLSEQLGKLRQQRLFLGIRDRLGGFRFGTRLRCGLHHGGKVVI